MQNICKDKTILILGGSYHHIKLVEAAKELQVKTVVTDYLEEKDSPTKRIADKAFFCDIKDIDSVLDICKKEKIDGIIATHLDPAQIPYATLCQKLNLPCIGTPEQFYCMTNKRAFKKMCIENNVDVIPEYSLEDVINNKIEYPVYVKPVDSRGSRGQSICYNKEELLKAIDFAKKNSSNEDVIIEKYIENGQEFHITYFFVNGTPYLIRTSDCHKGKQHHNSDKFIAGSIAPSKFTKDYLKTTNDKVIKMFQNLGIKNGPVFMQGFKDGNYFRFFDPGLRFPGIDFVKLYKKVFGVDLIQMLIIFALTGQMPDIKLKKNSFDLDGKKSSILFPSIKKGRINKITGEDKIKQLKSVLSYNSRYKVGDLVEWTYDINQRFAEIDILGNNISDIANTINLINSTLHIYNEENSEMLFQLFDTAKILNGDYE